jgi:SNF2 family DNA or RNA helicase
MNPHQVEWALFFFNNPLSDWVLLADEVWLGKTIEAWLVLCQLWSEFKRKIILVVPAALRKQWKSELDEKFFLPSEILDGKTFNEFKKQGIRNPFDQDKIVITSYQFAAKHESELVKIKRDVVVIDEAHNMRNVYRNPTWTAAAIQRIFNNTKKLLLTATPLQNSLMELYWLVSFIDTYTFWDKDSFRKQFSQPNALKLKDLRERLKPLMNRTLRSQVREYIRYTNRIPFTQSFSPTEEEEELYNKISEFLQDEDVKIISPKTRHLVVLVLRKLLASSSHAIAWTLDMMIDRLEKAQTIEDVIDDDDFLEEYDELIDDKDEQEELVDNLKQLRIELEKIRWFRDLAKNIKVDTKTLALQKALNTAFDQLKEMWANRKALIFTWFRRTQDYLKLYLESHGYEWKVVTFNGSNNDAQSRWIYNQWLEKYKGTEKISGSKTADMRAALVEYFKDEADIMIATESAAEWVNLQFCSLLINYDLPRNPQRIEQRIWRCHRYWQQHDVIVMNFLNEKNYADQRVFELLSDKFELFKWVFDASDKILWELWDWTDIEQKILNVYQTCRTKEEIDAAFKEIEESLKPEIDSHMQQTKKKVLEQFDAEVIKRLKNIEQEWLAKLWEFKEMFWDITRYYLSGYATFDEDNLTFNLNKAPTSWIKTGKYSIDKQDDTCYFHRTQSELWEWIIEQAKKEELNPWEIIFHPDNYHSKITILHDMKWKSWYLSVDKLTITSFDNEEYLICTCIDKDGNLLESEIAKKMLLVPWDFNWEIVIPETIQSELNKNFDIWLSKVYETAMIRNSTVLNEQINKLDARESDKLSTLMKSLDELKDEITATRREMNKETDWMKQLELRQKIQQLETKSRKEREEYFRQSDEIAEQKGKLIDELWARMRAGKEVKHLFTIKRTIQ